MGRVFTLKRSKKQQAALPKEFSAEEEALVSELHRLIGIAARGYHEVIVCKAIGVYMGDVMVKTEHPGMVIGGFMKHIEAVANIAIATHKRLEKQNAQEVYGTTHPQGAQGTDPEGQQRTGDAGAPQGGDRNLEVEEGQEVLLPAALEQRQGDDQQQPGLRTPGVDDRDAALDGGDLQGGPVRH